MEKTLTAFVQYEVELAGKETLIQVTQDFVRRCDLVRIKHCLWYPANLQVGFKETMDGFDAKLETSAALVWVKFYYNGTYKKPTSSMRAKWWDELCEFFDAPRNGQVWWHTCDEDRDVILESIDDSFSDLDSLLQDKKF